MASKALGAMLDRVRKHFGSRVDGDGVCGALPFPTQTSEPSKPNALPFLGVAQAPWATSTPGQTSQRDSVLLADSTLGFPDSGMTDTMTASQTFDQDIPNIDFPATSDMIDGLVDWGMWDNHILQQHVQQAGSWNNSTVYPAGPINTNMLPQAAGAPYQQPVIPGNALIMNGAAPITQGAHPNMLFDWQDLEDVDLDIRDYEMGGFWGRGPR